MEHDTFCTQPTMDNEEQDLTSTKDRKTEAVTAHHDDNADYDDVNDDGIETTDQPSSLLALLNHHTPATMDDTNTLKNSCNITFFFRTPTTTTTNGKS
jgi:hypothetical protein